LTRAGTSATFDVVLYRKFRANEVLFLVGVPFENPVEFVPLTVKEIKPRKPLKGKIKLKIDCSTLGKSSIDTLAYVLKKYLRVQIVGGDTVYTEGIISNSKYNEVWRTIDLFQCNIVC